MYLSGRSRDRLGPLDAGLFFISYERDPQQFVELQHALSRKDALNEYIVRTGSALFAFARRPRRLGTSARRCSRAAGSQHEPLKHRVDAREAAPGALLDAVLHRRVAFLDRREAHRLRQLRLLAEILELQRLQMVLERLHQPLRRLDLAELALDDAERRAEAIRPARAHVHLL